MLIFNDLANIADFPQFKVLNFDLHFYYLQFLFDFGRVLDSTANFTRASFLKSIIILDFP